MKSNGTAPRYEKTRRAILDALADLIVDAGPFGFSVQQVADRAGITHRTVYNHFPTREDLNEGLAVFVEEELSELVAASGEAHVDEDLAVGELPRAVEGAFPFFERLGSHVRAYVMLMVASRSPATLTRKRTARLRAALAHEMGVTEAQARLVTAALRMFISSTGWHLLTEHQELSTSEASRVAAWSLRTLLAAAKRGDLPAMEDCDGAGKRGADDDHGDSD